MMAVSCRSAAGMLMRLCILMLPAAPVLAQKNSTYSLSALIDSARHHLPLLLQKDALVSSAEAGITEAKHAFLPKVNLVEELAIGSANDLTGAFIPVPGVLHGISGGITAANNYQAGTSNIASVYGEYELVNFGLRGAKVDNARAVAGLSKADLAKELYMVKWQIARLWLDYRKASYQLAADEEDIRRYQSMFNITVALTSTGINAGVDSSLAKAGLSRTRVNYNLAMGNLRKLQQQLSYFTGIDHPGIAINGIDTGKDSGKGELSAEGTLLLIDTARGGAGAAGNPLADYYTKLVLQYQSEQVLIRKSYLPKVILGAGGWARGSSIQFSNDYKSLSEGLGYQRLNYTAGLGISYDLFNGLRKKDRLAVAGYQAAAAGYAFQQQELSLRNAASQADEAMLTAQQNLRELPVQLQAARDAYNQKVAQYKAGIINLVDLTNASFVLYQAQTDLIETMNGWYMAGLDKAAATGSLDPFIQTLK